MKKVRRVVGDIVSISLGDGHEAYAIVLPHARMAFFDLRCRTGDAPGIDTIVRSPVAFQVHVMKYAITNGLWPRIGQAAVPDALTRSPWFVREDVQTGELTITNDGGTTERSADVEDVARLETLAVWDPAHVADRLRDHFSGRANKWVESLRPQASRDS